MALTANQDWLYKQMSGMNVDLGSEEQFAQAMQDESNRQWVYEQAGKMGIDLGTPEQFASAMQMPDVAEVQKATMEGEKLRISDVQRPQDYEGESSFYGLSDEDLANQIGEYDQRRTAAQEALRQQQRSRKRSFAERLAAIDNPALQPAQDQIEVNNVRLSDEDEERYARLQQEKVWRERNSESYQELGDAILETRKLVNSLRDQNGRNIDSGGASAYLDKAIELYQAPSKYGQQSGFKNWAEGLGAQLSDYDTYTLGVTEAFRAGNMAVIVKKLNKGENLTDQEQANLQSFLLLSMVEQAREQDLSTGYTIGKQSAESIPFMLEMLATAGLGAAGEKALVKSIVKSGNRHLAERVARMFGDEYMITAARKKSGKIVKDIALNRVEQGLLERGARQVGEDVLMTAAMPTTWASVNNDRVNEMLFGDDHDYGFMDFMRSFTSATLETGTERWGGKIVDKTLNKVMPLDKIWGKQKWGKLLSNDFIQSPFGETGEEYINAMANAIRSVNPLYSETSNAQLREEAEQMFTPAGFAQTFLTVAPMSVFGGTVNVGIAKYKLSQYNNGKAQLTDLLTGLGASTEQAENIIRQIESSEDTSGFAGKVAETERILLYNYQVDHPNATKEEYETFKKQVDKTVGAYFKGAAYLNELTGELRDAYATMSEADKQRCRDAWNEYVVAEFENKVPEEPAQDTTPLSPAAAEHQRAVNEVTQAVRERTHGNGYIYPVAMPGNAEKTGFIVGEVVPVIDESNPEQLKIENDDIVTVKWSDGTVTQERARDLDLTGAPMMAQQAVDIEVENQMYGYTQQRIQNGEQPVLMRNGEGVLEGFFPTEGGLLEDQNGVQYTPEQLAEQGWQETKPVLFVNDTQQIAALDNGDGTYTQVDALGNPIAEPMSAEAFREQGFAMVPLEEEQPKSQAPVEAPAVQQAPVEQAPEVQQPEVQEPAAPVVPNIETMSAADYAGAAVEYMGSREYVDEYLDGEIKKVQQQLDLANRKKVGNVTDMADFKAKKDAIEAEKKALQGRLDKLTDAREKAKSYLTIAEREARAKAEAERRAAEEAARIARKQAAAAEAARLEQERIDRELKKGVPDFSEDNDRDARNRGFHVLNGQVIHRQEPLQPLATGKAVTVQFAKGQNGAAEAHHVLIPVSMAQPSHINGQRNPAFFISEAQPKDRRDQVSKVTSDMMAQNIHPDEIVEGATAYVGAPVLNGRGEAVQGNNRLDALIKMYQSHPESVAKYKQYLIDNAAALGYTEADIETIRNNDVIDVRMLDNVTDERAIQLGQKKATDLETGGVQLIDPQVTANQLGDRIQRFSEILLKSNDDEATLADLTLRNGRPALEFLQQLGIISDAQMQSAFDSRGNLTAEAKAALQGVLKQVLFQNAESDNLPIMFDDIPVTAQKAILQTIVRDLQSPEESRLVPDIQEAIGALYRALHQSAEVKNGRNEQEIRAAMRSWALQMQFPSDFDAENFVPSEKFSNFALELATLFKYGKQTEITKALNAYYDAVQGTTGGLFGDTPAIPYKEAIKQVFGIDYKSVDEARREKHRKELTDYLNTIADEAHPFELYGNDNVIEILKELGANAIILARAQELIDSGESILGIKGKGGRLLLNSDSLADKEAARSKYVHERQHLLTTQEQKENVLKAASVDELKLIVKVFTNGSDFYDRAGEDEIADEFISYSMEEAYAVESDEELESILRAAGANDELINIIKSINNEQRENDERLGQSERLGNARRHTDVDTDSEGHREQGGRDQGTESGVLEPKGARLDTRGELGGRTGGENQGSTEGAGLSEVGSERVSGEEAGGAGDNAGIAGENQGSSGVGQERGLGEVTQSPTDNRETSETRATETEIGGALVDRLGDMGVSVSTDLDANRAALKAAKADKSDTGAIHYYKTPSGQQYGFSYKGRIYLDPTKIDAELPIHEYGHLWAEAMRRISPESWRSVVDTIKADQASWDFVRALRPELTDENEIAEEVIATFSGKRGAERLRAEYKKMHGKDADYKSKWGNIFRNISKAIQDFWKAVGDFLNIKYQSAEQIYDQVLKDFVDNMNPYQKVRDFLRARDAEYIQAAESGDIQKATNIFYDALRENIGNGITPYMSVGTYLQFKRLAKGVKTRDAAIIREAAEKIAPLIPDNAVLVPTPSHTGRATDMLDLAKAVAEITGSEVADVLRSAPRESQYQAKKATGVPMASGQLGITMEGTLPEGKTPIIIDNVVDSGNTAEACVQAVGRAVVVTIGDSAEQYRHAASLKSAAPVLRDKAGKVIPLSKRFEPKGSRYLGRRMYLSSNDPRFAISGTQVIPVGDKTLVGLHNISAEKLRKAIKMGGLANPSTAVINIASQNHEQYGDISLIMPSSLVDSKTGRNAGTFTGDIWSPTYPSVERIMSDKGDEAYYQAITKAFGDNEARRPILSRAKLDFDDYLDSGNIRAGLAYWYLLEKGIEPGDVYFNSGISDDIKERFRPLYDKGILDLTKEDYRTLLSLIAEQQGKTAEDMLQDAQESKARYQQTIDDPEAKQFYKKIAQQAIDEIDLYGVRYNVLSNGYHAMERAIRNDGKIDLDSTLIAAQDIVQTQHQADFDKWLSDMDKRFDIKEVLFEDYDRDGNRIYKPHTLANASRMMNKEDLQNAGDHSGLGATRGQLVKRMETLADIRAEKGRLRPGAEEDFETEEWNKMQDEWFNKVLNPLSEMQKISDNPFSQVGYAETRLQEALRSKDPIATLNKEYGYKIDPNGEWAKNLRDMVQRVKDLPTKYFETKFRRPVYLDEFANAVVPVGLPQDLRDGLTGAGMTLFEYDPAEQGSRRAATLKATADEGIRFSISGNTRTRYADEMESIKNEAVNNGTFMQAPNGKPTNLDERQWLQVRLRSFKRWFGDWENNPKNASKVVDENGEPMVVYHGTKRSVAGFTTFEKNGTGIFLADIDTASWYSDDDRPTVLKGVPHFKSWDEVKEYAEKYDIPFQKADEEEYDEGYEINGEFVTEISEASEVIQAYKVENYYDGTIYACFLNIRNPKEYDYEGHGALDGFRGKEEPSVYFDRLMQKQYGKKAKYDGMICYNIKDRGGYMGGIAELDEDGRLENYYDNTVYIVPNPNQIKSATNNDGSFSEENDDIRFAISNQNNDIFYSNAERAVEGIKQEKATPEQWRAMIEKAGGLKAGEDKWIGLSDWLAQQRPTVTPQKGETRSQYIARVAETVKNMTPRNTTIDDAIRFSITVNHNSPYLLKRADGSFVDPETGERLGFDHRFMGKGEGGQAHGWGSYFSVNDLRDYADPRDGKYLYKGKAWNELWNEHENPEMDAASYVVQEMEYGKTAEEALASAIEDTEASVTFHRKSDIETGTDYAKGFERRLEALMKLDVNDFSEADRGRHHYTVEIPDNNGSNYLDEIKTLPKPLRRKIAAAVRELPGEPMPSVKYVNYTGGWNQLAGMIERNQWAYMEIRDRLVEAFGGYPIESEKKLSEMMSSLGFVGVHYDGRRDGECYVIFDENDAKITDHIRFAISGRGANSDKQKIWIQWHEDNPHPKYEEGEGLDHYRERLERWETLFNEMKSKTKDMPESEPEQPKSEPQFETAEQKAEREEIYPSYMSPKEILEKAIALNSQRMSPDAVILRHNVINNMRKLREQIRRLQEAESSEVGTITSEIEQGVRSRSVALRAEYEKSAKMITDIAKALFRGKVFQGMTDQDFSKMLTNIRDASTKFDLQKNIEIMEDIVQRVQGRYLRLSQEAVSQAASITLQRRNQSGVDIGKRVDPLHFVMISQFNALRNTNLTKINTTLADLNSQIKEEISDTELDILSAKIAGAERAKTYQEELNRLQTDLDKIDSDIAQLDKYVSRNELKGNKRKEFMEHRRSLMSERAELIDELILLNDNTVEQLSSITRDGHSKFLERIQQKQEHKIEILRMMARDLHGIRSDEGAKEEDKGGLKDNYLSPLRTFTHELRKFGTHSAGGEGYLYSYFAPLAHDARTNYLLHIRERMEILDNKARELFGEKATWNSVMKSVSNQLTEVEYKWRNVGADNTTVNSAGVQKSVKKPKVKYLTNGQIMYIYMVNKMTDGKAKLEQMGIDDATVAELKAKLPKELVQLADWLQEEYFPMTRKRYNETNIYLFDTPMAEIANYVPLKISGNAIDPKVDVGTGDMHLLPSNIVGNAISRTYNKKPIDIENTDAMDLVVQNMLTMEHWSAYAELITDLNTLLNSASFKHRIEQMNPNNYDNFFKTAQLAVDQYRPDVGPADKFVTGLTRFIATSKISLRWWTAIKQRLSAPSPLSEADPEFHKQYAKAYFHCKDNFQWAMENLPIFRERWESKQGGNEKLNIAEINSKSQKIQDMLEWAQENLVKYGISANAFVDAITCANMAKAQYDTKKKYYTERGYSPEAVERLAKWKADEIYNETQQSSEGAYISAMQRDRTFVSSAISLFNNSSMAYTRKNAEALREIYKIAVGDKQAFIDFRKEQLMKDGMAEDQAAKFAETDYKRARTHAIADMAINGYFIQFVWNVGGKAFKTLLAVLPFLFFGDDDKKKRAKEELLADLKKDAIVTGIQPIRGLPFGASAEAFLNVVYDRLSDEENRRYMSKDEIAGRASSNIHPAIQDVSKLLSTLTKDEVDKLNFASYLVNLATSTGTSVDAQTVANELWALEDVIERSFHGKLTWSDIRNDVSILLNVPPSQIEYMILQPRKNETRDEFVQRYTEYVKLTKYGWFTPVVKTDDVELSNSQEDRVYNAFYNY